jgi:anti-sigma regulatory factor (Ser/Thr protein kinase)
MLQGSARLYPWRDEIDQTAMAAHPSRLTAGPGRHWLMMAAEMAGLLNGDMRPPPEPIAMGRARPPRIATRLLGADPGSVHAARGFTAATLHRWGAEERSSDITLVVSELLTNALRHAGSGDTGPRPVWLGLFQPGPCVLCAVADPSKAVPAPRTPGSLGETGRGLHIIRALSDQWGYTAPSEAGKVVWALFRSRLTSSSPAPYPRRRGRDRLQNLAARLNQPALPAHRRPRAGPPRRSWHPGGLSRAACSAPGAKVRFCSGNACDLATVRKRA